MLQWGRKLYLTFRSVIGLRSGLNQHSNRDLYTLLRRWKLHLHRGRHLEESPKKQERLWKFFRVLEFCHWGRLHVPSFARLRLTLILSYNLNIINLQKIEIIFNSILQNQKCRKSILFASLIQYLLP